MAFRGLAANNTGQQKRENKSSEWDKMLAQARLAMELDGRTALGLGLGKFLRHLWDQNLAEQHARDDLKEKRNAEIASGSISDVEAFRKANGNPTPITLPPFTPAGAGGDAVSPVTGETWERYSVLNGLPNPRDYRQEAREQAMPVPQINTGLTAEELAAALAAPYKERKPYYFGGGF